MVSVKVKYKDLSTAKRFVDSCENNFKRKINKTCDSILSNRDIKIVTLCGPTCSGKTTTAAIITAAFERQGKRARVLSIDDFYYDKDMMAAKNITDFEGADAIDIELLRSVINDLISGEKTLLPTFDFKERNRVAMTEYQPDENDIYVIEGIQAMYPEVTDILDKSHTRSIFISVADSIDVCGVYFEANEIRLCRRIVRDFFYRNSTAADTMAMWENVRKNEEKNIFPYGKKADHVINSLLSYEPFVISSFFMDITDNFDPVAAGYSVICSLRTRMSRLTDSCINSAVVPDTSVFKEFII